MASHSTQRKQPQPVLTRAGIVTVLAVLSALLVHFGAPSWGAWVDAHSSWIAGAILTVAPPVSAWLARRHVTPLASPKDNDGNDLVPAGSTRDTDAAAAAALAQAEAIYPSDTGDTQ